MYLASHCHGFNCDVQNLTSIRFITSSVSLGSTITLPNGILNGDLLFIADFANGSTPSTVVPSGFNSIVNNADGDYRQISSYKIADGTENGSVLTGMNGSGIGADNNKACLVFRSNIPARSATISSPNGQATTGNPSGQVVPASSALTPLIVFGCYGTDGGATTDSFSPTRDGEVSSGELIVAFKIFNAALQDVSVDMDDEGNNIMQSFYIRLS